MIQSLIVDTIPIAKDALAYEELRNQRAEDLFEAHFKANFVKMQTDRIINVRMLVSETIGLLFKRHESVGVRTPSFSSMSSDGDDKVPFDGERDQVKKKVYLRSRLCNDEAIIGMVRRLAFDQNRDINMPLKHIELPQLNEPKEVELTEATLSTMRRQPLLTEEETIDTTNTARSNSQMREEPIAKQAAEEQIVTDKKRLSQPAEQILVT